MSVPLWPVHLALATICASAQLLGHGPARAVILVCFSAASPLLALRPTWSVGKLVLASPVLALPAWSLAAFLGWPLGVTDALAAWPVLLALALAAYEWTARRRLSLALTGDDLVAALACALAGAAFAWIASANGFQPDGSYHARAFWKLDTFFFFSMVEATAERAGVSVENPLVGGAPNLYGTAAHAGVAALLGRSPAFAAALVPALAAPVIIASLGLTFHVLRGPARGASPTALALAGAGTVLWFALRPDLECYPQTHALVYGAMVATVLLLEPAGDGAGELARRWHWAPGLLLALYVTASHAVTAAALVSWLGVGGLHAFLAGARAEGRVRLGIAAVCTAAWLALYLPPYPSPGGPLTAEGLALVREHVAPWVVPGVAIVWLALARRPGEPRALGALGPLAVGLVYWALGAATSVPEHRWFTIFNAERLPHAALLFAFMGLGAVSRARAWIALGAIAVGSTLARPTIVTLIPGLITGPPAILGLAELELLAQVRALTPLDARILTLPGTFSPVFALPAFTGRVQAPLDASDIWSIGALPAGGAVLLAEEVRSFTGQPPSVREAIVTTRGYTHLVLATAPGDEPRAVVHRLLPGLTTTLLASAGTRHLFELGPAPAP